MKQIILLIITLLIVPIALSGQSLKEIKNSGQLRAAFTQADFESIHYLLAKEFAAFLNVELVVVNADWAEFFQTDGKIPDKKDNLHTYKPDIFKKADIICSSIYLNDRNQQFFKLSGLMDLSDVLLIPQSAKDLKAYQDLSGLSIAIPNNKDFKSYEFINDQIENGKVRFIKSRSVEVALDLLNEGTINGFVTDAFSALKRVRHENFKITFPVSEITKSGWAVEKGSADLATEITNFFEAIKANGRLDELFKEQFKLSYKDYLSFLHSYGLLDKLEINQKDLDEILESGKLVVALRERLMVFDDEEKQFNQYLAEEFAKFLGVELELVMTPHFARYFENLNGEIDKDSVYTPEWFNNFDLACDIIVPLDWRQKKVHIIPFIPYAQVVIGRKDKKIVSLNDLKNFRGVTSKGSAQEDILLRNNIKNYYYTRGDRLLRDISEGNADYTIGTDAVYRISRFENLEAKFVVGQVGKFGWAVKKNQPKLKQKILEFFDYAKKAGILDKYFEIQTGMSLQETADYLSVLQETYQPGVFPFVFYGTKNGLPQEDVLAVFQDRDNYLWFGTHSGVVKYNGRVMSVYNSSNGLSNNSVFEIAQDLTGKMYFATQNGVSVYSNDSFETILSGHAFRGVFVDKDNQKWFYGDDGIYLQNTEGAVINLNQQYPDFPKNVYAIATHQKATYIASQEGLFVTDENRNILKITDISCFYILVDAFNRLWVSHINGMHLIELDSYKNNGLGANIGEQLNLPENTLFKKIIQASNGTIWLLSEEKIFQLITLKQKPIVFDERIGMMKQRIHSFLEDHEGNLWIGYSGGIEKLSNRSLRLLYPEEINSYVNSIVEDEMGRMWLGLNSRVFVLKEKLENYTAGFSENNKSYVVGTYKNGDIILASTAGIYRIDKNNLKLIDKNIFESPVQFIEKLFISSSDEIFLLTGSKGVVYYLKDHKSNPVALSNNHTSLIHQLVEFENRVIGGNNKELVYFKESGFEKLTEIGEVVWSLCPDGEKLWVGTDRGIGYLKNNRFSKVSTELSNQLVTAIKPGNNKDYLWLGGSKGFSYYNKMENRLVFSVDASDGLQGNEISIDGLYPDKRGVLWVGTYHGISTYSFKKDKRVVFAPEGKIERFFLNGDEIGLDRLKNGLKYYENNIQFEISGLSFKDEESVEYEFYMKGLKNDYAASKGTQFKAQYTNLPPGQYEFYYRSRGNDGFWSYYKKIVFEIYKPFYAEWWFIILSVIVLLTGFYGLVRWRNATLRRRNTELENIVKLRTAEIIDKNEELLEQNEEIITQRDRINEQHIAITDSIEYAQRIQQAVLPREIYVEEVLPESFILFHPRDIVSGDFYWIKQLGKYKIIIAADCTGHGVPGSMMSMLGVSFINEIIQKREIIQANIILNELRDEVKKALRQTSEVDEIFDGMDMALCVINTETLNLQYAGAANPLYYVQNGELHQVKADRMPIGHYPKETEFTMHNIQMKKGSVFYIFSDGLVDQFGGRRGDKMKAKRFREVLFSNHQLPMSKQKQKLQEALDEWQGTYEQTDDILVIGVRV